MPSRRSGRSCSRRSWPTRRTQEEYLAENVFWVPKEARWSHLQAKAKQTTIGKDIDDAMLAIETSNASLKGVLPKDYARPALNKVMLGELIDLVSGIGMAEEADRSRDILGRVYEYFLGGFAGAEGKRGGEFYTPRSVVRLLVEMLEPYKGRIYDPCCGSGGMFVQSEKFVEEHGGRIGDIAIYGQESNYTTWRLAKMNLAVRGIDADIRWNNEGSFHKDELQDLKADSILANPPFNISDWGGDRLREDARWKFGDAPRGQRQLRLGSSTSTTISPRDGDGRRGARQRLTCPPGQSGEGDIRRAMDKRATRSRLHDRLFARPALLLDPDSRLPVVSGRGSKEPWERVEQTRRAGEVLFIDARKLGPHWSTALAEEFTDEDIVQDIARTYQSLAACEPETRTSYEDIAGFLQGSDIGGDRGRTKARPGRRGAMSGSTAAPYMMRDFTTDRRSVCCNP